MAKPEINIHDLLGLKRGWTPIALVHGQVRRFSPRLLELARERRWRLISLSKFEGNLPSGLDARGALTDQLPTGLGPRFVIQQGVPMVRIGNWPHPQDHVVPAVIPDHVAIGRLAAEHFAERDFKHVACIGRDPWGNNQSIYEAFAARAAELGCRCHLLLEDAEAIQSLPTTLERWHWRRRHFIDCLKELPRPVGMLMFSNLQADRCCQWVLEAGLRVPTDVAVLGLGNDTVLCECATVPTSSIAYDHDGLTETAVATLAQLIAGHPPERPTIRVPPLGVVTRQSTDVLAASNPTVASALRFMWEHVTEDLSVDQIAAHVGVSRRTLEKVFQRELGRGINGEFQRRRIEKARELLIHTDLKIADLAKALNFSSHNYFCRVFRQAYGASPARYRQDHHDTQ